MTKAEQSQLLEILIHTDPIIQASHEDREAFILKAGYRIVNRFPRYYKHRDFKPHKFDRKGWDPMHEAFLRALCNTHTQFIIKTFGNPKG